MRLVFRARPTEKGLGIFRDWIYELYRDDDDPLSEATPPFKWIYAIYEKEHWLNRLVNRLLGIEKSLHAENERLHELHAENERMRHALQAENEHLRQELLTAYGGRGGRVLWLARTIRVRIGDRLRGTARTSEVRPPSTEGASWERTRS